MKTKVRKYFGGGLADTASAGAASINQALIQAADNADAKKAATRAELQAQSDEINNSKKQDLADLEEFQEEGYALDTYYKLGGGLKTPSSSIKGGIAKPLSSDSVVMKGNKHEESKIDNTSGIKLMEGGKAYAEVEDDEVIKDGVKVFSDTLKTSTGKTYAEEAEKLAKQKGKLESDSTNKFTKNTNSRKAEILDKKEDALFNEQEASKSSSNPRYAKLGSTLSKAMPFVDNAVNALLTATTPKVPKPTFVKAANLETNINVNDQLNDVNRAVDANANTILGNTSNSAAARNAISSTRLKGAALKSKIKTNEQNSELKLRNADARNKQSISQINSGIENNYRTAKLARKGEIQSRISANASNLADDFIEKKNFDAEMDYNDESLAALKTMYDNGNGVVDRSDSKFEAALELLKRKRKQ